MEATVDPTLACGVLTCFGRQWELHEFTDFTVHIAGKDFKCHRIILESCSKFFCGSQNDCSLKDIEPEIFELILEAMYKGRNILNVDNALNVWAAACKLEIGFLVQVCEEFVMGMITVDNYMSIYRMATSLNSGKVLHTVRQMIVQEFHNVMFSKTFVELTLDDVLAVISCRDIKICSDGLVQVIFTWVNTEICDGWDKEKREDASNHTNTMDVHRTDKARSKTSDQSKHLGTLLEAVNLHYISDDCLSKLMSDDMVLTCPRAVRAVNVVAVQRLGHGGASYCGNCTSKQCLLHNQQPLKESANSTKTPPKTPALTSTVDPVLACGVINCLGQFRDLQAFSDMSDFMVQVGGKTVKCHKFILGSCSEFFSGLLRSDMREKAENRAEIKGIRSCIFELILEVLYRGRNILTTDNMIEVWHAANQLQIVFLLKACEEFIIANITVESFVDIYKNATVLMSGDVLQATRKFIKRNFNQILRSDSFPDLSTEDLLDIFGNKHTNVLCANCIVQSILKWTSAARHVEVGSETLHADTITSFFSDRSRDLEKLMEAVKLETVSDGWLKQLMSDKRVQAAPRVIRAVNAIAVQRLKTRQLPSENCNGNGSCLKIERRRRR